MTLTSVCCPINLLTLESIRHPENAKAHKDESYSQANYKIIAFNFEIATFAIGGKLPTLVRNLQPIIITPSRPVRRWNLDTSLESPP